VCVCVCVRVYRLRGGTSLIQAIGDDQYARCVCVRTCVCVCARAHCTNTDLLYLLSSPGNHLLTLSLPPPPPPTHPPSSLWLFRICGRVWMCICVYWLCMHACVHACVCAAPLMRAFVCARTHARTHARHARTHARTQYTHTLSHTHTHRKSAIIAIIWGITAPTVADYACDSLFVVVRFNCSDQRQRERERERCIQIAVVSPRACPRGSPPTSVRICCWSQVD
jgi:hypothetical protein